MLVNLAPLPVQFQVRKFLVQAIFRNLPKRARYFHWLPRNYRIELKHRVDPGHPTRPMVLGRPHVVAWFLMRRQLIWSASQHSISKCPKLSVKPKNEIRDLYLQSLIVPVQACVANHDDKIKKWLQSGLTSGWIFLLKIIRKWYNLC